MKKSLFVTALLGFLAFANAEQTVGEKMKETGRDVKSSVKKGVNRVEEKTCLEGDLECGAEKAGNRVKEGGSWMSNKTKDTKEKVDND